MHTEILQYVTRYTVYSIYRLSLYFFFHAVLFHPAKPSIISLVTICGKYVYIDHVYLVSPGLKLFCIDMHMHDFREK